MAMVALLAACNDDDETSPMVEAGSISGGPFSFVVDGTSDFVSGISTDGTGVGANSSWIITDDQNNILGLPATIVDLEGVDFDGAGVGTCLIWYIRYEGALMGLMTDENTSDLQGDFDLSNSIRVDRLSVDGGTLSGGPFNFDVDGMVDNVSGIVVTGSLGANNTWVITDDQNNILGLPGTLMDLEGVDFDGAGVGVCLIWHLSYQEGLEGLMVDNNVSDLTGADFDLSNSIQVNRNITAGNVMGGPFNFDVDGVADMVSGISVSGSTPETNTSWVITDDQGNILGLPPTLNDLEDVDFDGAGVGVCLIYHIAYLDGLTGLMADNNINADLSGTFDLSNSITVNRN